MIQFYSNLFNSVHLLISIDFY